MLEAATRLGFWVVFAPARITWLVQPLDVFVFRNYKRCLQKAHRRLISGAPGGVVTNALWLSQLTKTASEFLSHRNWHDAFVQTGATGSQTTLTKALESFNGFPSPQLTASNLRALFPRNRQVDLNSLFNPVLQAVQAHLRARQWVTRTSHTFSLTKRWWCCFENNSSYEIECLAAATDDNSHVGNTRTLRDFSRSIFIASLYAGLRHERTPGCLSHIKCLGGLSEERKDNLMERTARLKMIFQWYRALVELNTPHRFPFRRSSACYIYVCLFAIIMNQESTWGMDAMSRTFLWCWSPPISMAI